MGVNSGMDLPSSGDQPDRENEQLVAAAIRGDEEALRRVWHEHRRWVAAVLLAHMPRTAELDDLLQEVAVAVVAKISGLRDAAAFKPWLRAVAMSIAKTTARRSNVRKAGWLKVVSFTGSDDERASGRSGDASGAALQEGRRLMELASDIPDGYREPLLLKCIQGMSYRQIGEVMNLPETTIETRIARGRRMLRERAIEAGLRGASEAESQSQDESAAKAAARSKST
jgi:RNA polymerase sigma-70 factor, ECF subfamily